MECHGGNYLKYNSRFLCSHCLIYPKLKIWIFSQFDLRSQTNYLFFSFMMVSHEPHCIILQLSTQHDLYCSFIFMYHYQFCTVYKKIDHISMQILNNQFIIKIIMATGCHYSIMCGFRNTVLLIGTTGWTLPLQGLLYPHKCG